MPWTEEGKFRPGEHRGRPLISCWTVWGGEDRELQWFTKGLKTTGALGSKKMNW